MQPVSRPRDCRHRGLRATSELASSDLLPSGASATARRGRVCLGVLARDARRGRALPRHRSTARTDRARRTARSRSSRTSSFPCLPATRPAGSRAGPTSTRSPPCSPSRPRASAGAGDVAALLRHAVEATADLWDRRADWLPQVAAPAGRQGRRVRRRAGPTPRVGPAVGADAPRGPPTRLDGLRDRRLEPRRRLSDQDPRLPPAAAPRLAIGRGAPHVDLRSRLHRGRGRRRRRVGARCPLRYRHDDEDDVRLLTETLVAELLAQRWWAS